MRCHRVWQSWLGGGLKGHKIRTIKFGALKDEENSDALVALT